MRRHTIYRYALPLGIFLLSTSLYACNFKLNTQAINNNNLHNLDASNESIANTDTDIPSSIPTKIPDKTASANSTNSQPTQAPEKREVILNVKGKSISIGDSKEYMIDTFGLPNRILNTEYDFDYYVYNNDYRKLVFFAVKDDHIVGFYTDSLDFNFLDISSGDSIGNVNQALDEHFSMSEVLKHKTNLYTLKVLMDKIGSQKVIGIYVLDHTVKKDKFTKEVSKNIELMVYDLTNSIRVRNGEDVLSWSSSAAKAARKHSKDMAARNFFDHINPEGQSPGERLQTEGISYSTNGENIIAGFGTAIISTNGWYNSTGHRDNLLNPNYRYLGVGFTYDPESRYSTYITQNFYR
jgi:uncharacterized protein YkwD